MKYYLKPGLRVGKLVLLKRLPMLPHDYAYKWECLCDCGEKTVKSRVVLTNPHLMHRCSSCFAKSQKAHKRLLLIDQGERP